MTKTTKIVLILGAVLIVAGTGAYFYFKKKPKATIPTPIPTPTPNPTPISNILQDAFDNLNFDFGKSTIRSSSFPALDKLAQTLVDAKNWKIDIEGHTDNKGSDSVNQKLSQDRANSVKTYLISKNVAVDSISSKGFGKSKPLVNNDSDANRDRNRRVEFKITKPNNEIINIKA